MSEPKRFILSEAFDSKNSKVIQIQTLDGVPVFRVAVKIKNSRHNKVCIYISRELNRPLVELLTGKVKTGFHFATTQDLNSPGWQRLGDF